MSDQQETMILDKIIEHLASNPALCTEANLRRVAEENGLSVKEIKERIANVLTPEKIKKLKEMEELRAAAQAAAETAEKQPAKIRPTGMNNQELRQALIAWLSDETKLEVDEALGLAREYIERKIGGGRVSETQKMQAEDCVWKVLLKLSMKPFCCGGVGYLLPSSGVPVAVTEDGREFNGVLLDLGINPGSPMRRRVGKYVGAMCDRHGTHTDTRLAFYFDPATFAAYVAADRGVLIKVTRWGFDEVPNGEDGQLFVYPENWQTLLSKPLDEMGEQVSFDHGQFENALKGRPNGNELIEFKGIGRDSPKTDLVKRSLFVDGFLARHLFGGTNFEIRSMNETQVRILILAYLMFLMMPGVVSERAMLQALGPSGSGKTFFLELFGHLLLGPTFMVRPMPEDIREFENQIINEYFAVYDNVSKVPSAIKDRFCQAVTGIEVVRRELFTTAGEARYKSKATIAVSAITPPLAELEHQNRTVTINFQERTESTFVAKEELFKVVDENRDEIMIDLLRRMTLVLEALEAQKDYVPKVNVRLASIAQFILRIAKHEGWEDNAQKLLDAWSGEQTGYAIQEDDISTAMTRYVGGSTFKPNVEMTATMLNEHLCHAIGGVTRVNLSWEGNALKLANRISRNLKVYASRFGLERQDCTLRNSRGGYSYRFNPQPALLASVKAEAKYERENLPVNDFGPS